MTSKAFFYADLFRSQKDTFGLPALLAKLITHHDLWARQTNHTSL